MGGPYGQIQHFVGFGGLDSLSGTTGTLPAGLALGQERWEGGVKYRLFCNASTQSAVTGSGFRRYGGSAAGGNGPYSVTVTTVTEAVSGIACAAQASVATGFYFWGATLGHPCVLLASNVSIGTDKLAMPAAAGKFTLTATGSAGVAMNAGDSTTGTATTDAAGGRFFVFFEHLTFRQ